MVITGFGPDLFFQRGQKGNNIMSGGFLNGKDTIHINIGLLADDLHCFGRDAAHFCPGLTNGQFYGKPGAVAVFQCPDGTHFRAGITLYHAAPVI